MCQYFAAFYEYDDNGNVSRSTFHNPDIALGSNHNTYWYDYSYDGLSRLTEADYVRGGDATNVNAFDLSGLYHL